jgi:hypothetical protein
LLSSEGRSPDKTPSFVDDFISQIGLGDDDERKPTTPEQALALSELLTEEIGMAFSPVGMQFPSLSELTLLASDLVKSEQEKPTVLQYRLMT